MDQDGDGQINVSEFCSAMSMIRQAKVQQQQTMSLNWPAGSTGGMVNRGGDVIIILIIVTGAKPYA